MIYIRGEIMMLSRKVIEPIIKDVGSGWTAHWLRNEEWVRADGKTADLAPAMAFFSDGVRLRGGDRAVVLLQPLLARQWNAKRGDAYWAYSGELKVAALEVLEVFY